jgi:hypothetical protein
MVQCVKELTFWILKSVVITHCHYTCRPLFHTFHGMQEDWATTPSISHTHIPCFSFQDLAHQKGAAKGRAYHPKPLCAQQGQQGVREGQAHPQLSWSCLGGEVLLDGKVVMSQIRS